MESGRPVGRLIYTVAMLLRPGPPPPPKPPPWKPPKPPPIWPRLPTWATPMPWAKPPPPRWATFTPRWRALSYRGIAGSGSIGSCLRDKGGHEEDRDRDAQQDDREEGVGIEVVAGEVDRGTGEAEGELVALS